MAMDTNNFSEIFKNSDSDTVSKTEKSIKEAATERKDAAVLEMLKQQDPDTYRMFLAKAEKMEALPHVKPGDLITADLINALIDRINALEGGGESVLNLGPLALQAHTLIALAGEIKAGAGLWLDGERLLDKDDEVANLAVLDGATLALRLALVGDGNQLEAALEKLGHGNTILLRKGDVMMAQVSSTQKDGDAGATLRRQQTLIGVIQTDNDLELSPYLDSIQFDHQPFSWGLYNIRLKRFVLGGASENARLRNELVQVHEAKTVGDIK